MLSPLVGTLLPLTVRVMSATVPALVPASAWWDWTQSTFDATGAATTTGGAVATWTDKIASYAGTQGTGANRPTLTSSGLTFDGTDRLILSGDALGLLTAVDGATIIAVAKGSLNGRFGSWSTTASANNSRLTFGGSSGSGLLSVQRPDGTSGQVTGPWSPSSTIPQVLTAIANFQTREGLIRLNKTPVASTTTLTAAGGATTATNSAAAQLGATGNGGSVLTATVYDILVFRVALTIAQSDAWIDYLATLRGFTL